VKRDPIVSPVDRNSGRQVSRNVEIQRFVTRKGRGDGAILILPANASNHWHFGSQWPKHRQLNQIRDPRDCAPSGEFQRIRLIAVFRFQRQRQPRFSIP
jgi:hypothetical protein